MKSVNEAKDVIGQYADFINSIDVTNVRNFDLRKQLLRDLRPFFAEDDLIDIDHDAGEYVEDGGDYIKLLDWFEEQGYDFLIHIHSQNPVGVENMRRIIRRNGWKEIL
ncbi:MAG: hypothetical protein IJH34_07560 [Romboutsia sp.]|nr:hypothetical protein [Romboutsia sp.]